MGNSDLENFREILDEEFIRDWCGSKSYSRGREYFQDGEIHNATIIDNTLFGESYGNYDNEYDLEVDCDENGIDEAYCSCPVGSDGDCKHIAALLLTWLHNPEKFHSPGDFKAALDEKSKEELIELIQTLSKVSKEAQELIRAFVGSNDIAGIKEKIHSAFRIPGSRWIPEYAIYQNIKEILLLAHELELKQNYENAFEVVRLLSDELKFSFDTHRDESGLLREAISKCIETMTDCLNKVSDKSSDSKSIKLRQDITQQLFSLLTFDFNSGGIGISDLIIPAMVNLCTTDEKNRLATRALNIMKPLDREQQASFIRSLGTFYLAMKGDSITEKQYIKICKDSGLIEQLIDKLLNLERYDEVKKLTMTVNAYQLPAIAEIFASKNRLEIIEEVIFSRPDALQDGRPYEWLKKYYLSTDQKDSALTVALELYDHRPGFEQYQEIVSMIKSHPKKEQIETELIERAESEKYPHVAVRIYLSRGEIKTAWDLYLTTYNYIWDELTTQIAKAAQKVYPEAVIELYKKQAEYHIRIRGRENYQIAVQYLAQAGLLCKKTEKQNEFHVYVESLKEINKRLPSFLSEINRRLPALLEK